MHRLAGCPHSCAQSFGEPVTLPGWEQCGGGGLKRLSCGSHAPFVLKERLQLGAAAATAAAPVHLALMLTVEPYAEPVRTEQSSPSADAHNRSPASSPNRNLQELACSRALSGPPPLAHKVLRPAPGSPGTF